MKSVNIDNIDKLTGTIISENDSFLFKCHSGLKCFNLCCRNLNLFLYPYDVLRLKKHLKISSDEFIDKYVDIVLRETNFFPEVLLRMSDVEEKTCPFLTDAGCKVYLDRPDTCRSFPIEQGVIFDRQKKPEILYFFRPPDFCHGQYEDIEWTTTTWANDQDAVKYNKMTILWAGIKGLFAKNPWGIEGLNGSKAKMAFIASYNIDSFRDFVFKSSFLKRYKVKSDILKKIKKSDTELMKFGFSWIRLYIWGIKTKKIRL